MEVIWTRRKLHIEVLHNLLSSLTVTGCESALAKHAVEREEIRKQNVTPFMDAKYCSRSIGL
jgi:hypothetical protein